ncbi:DUF982 domain-containing protein [Rhizobium sp. KVB221]|uniref:DUF982 domain-containing protein n=2 Tax=Rhizobium setariae TaxID=2801340 RepID=A0A936YRL0_9HYPH|nr:DUF982 domain-containing protein [Rhizobium setariae]
MAIPVIAELPSGAARIFSSASDACDFLERDWPDNPSEHHERAILLCRSASLTLVSSEAAREAFVAACLAASINVRGADM